MKFLPIAPLFFATVFSVLFLSGCDKPPVAQSEATPLHGGVLTPLGNQYQLEVVLDRAEGSIYLHVLDAQARNPITTSNEGLELQVAIGSEEPRFLILDPGADVKTGEIAGNTSFFRRLETDWLKTHQPVKVVVDRLLVRGRKYDKIEVLLPAAH